MSQPLFLSVTGDYPNIGDAFIRREAVRWVRDTGPSLVYGREAPDVWLEQVGVTADDTVLQTGRLKWLWAIATRRRPVVAFEPGEVRLDHGALPREMLFCATALIVKAKKGVFVLPPRAVVGGRRATLLVHRLTSRLATVSLWREPKSIALVGAGELSPDIAFAGDHREGRSTQERDKVLVSLRGRREYPSKEWIEGLSAWTRARGLKIVTAAQVREDEEKAARLAEDLGGEHFEWIGDDIEHEERLRTLYESVLLAVSDRLHVLIISSLSGSVPTEMVMNPVGKVATHFAQIGFERMSKDSSTMRSEDIANFLDAQAGRSEELRERLVDAQNSLLDVERRIHAAVAAAGYRVN